MYLGNLSDTDRTIARIVRWSAIVLLGGLTISGIWLFFTHEPASSWGRYRPGSDVRPQPVASTGIAEVHAAIADLCGLLALFVVAWLSSRVLHRVSKFAVGALVLVMFSMYTGTLIRFNATIDDGAVLISNAGYGQFYWGSADVAITDRFDLGRWSMVLWTLVHIISVPVLIWATSFSLDRAEQQRLERKGKSTSWLDTLSTR